MKKFLFLLCSLSLTLVFGQNRKGEFSLQPSSNSHSLYIAFKSSAGDRSETLAKALSGNPEFHNFIQQNGLQFHGEPLLPQEKIEEMAAFARSRDGDDKAVRKLERIYKVTAPQPDNESLLRLAKDFEKFDEVEYASLMSNQPLEPPLVSQPAAAPTPNLESLQTYFYGNPGISADFAWNLGITGQDLTIRDVEYGFNVNHEALANQPQIQIEPGYSPNSSLIYPAGANYSWLDHGTAVASILGAKRDNVGVGGSVPKAVKIVSYLEWTTLGYNRTAAVSRAIAASAPYDIVIYEMQTGGQNNQYVPAEYDNVIWDMTKAATDAGITVIAAAGNGSENLDGPFYASYMARGNSGAIIVGAGSNSTAHSRLSFSTYGSRVDLQGWGQGVLSAGYGNYAMYDNDYQRTYTYFSGTSSATPVVASAFALLQSYHKQQTGNYLAAPALLALLKTTGYPQGGDTTKNIGEFPNVKNAIEQLQLQLAANDAAHKKLTVTVAPNPASDVLFVKSARKMPITVEVISAAGQVILKKVSVSQELQLNVSQFLPGNYVIKVTDTEGATTQKFLKK